MKTTQLHTPHVQVFVGGCTGSNVVSEERYLREYDAPGMFIRPVTRNIFGMHTTALGIRIDSTVGEWLKAVGVTQVFILQTHYHVDHVAGLTVNGCLMSKDLVKGIYGPSLGTADFAG
jgi:hypothetical protein